jgi:RNA polymerase sigma factor (sigma-70 family)
LNHEDGLLKKIRAGDVSGLDELVAFYYPGILRYCMWHTQNRQMAEDAAQETFLKVVKHLDSYVHHGKFKAYLYKIASNVCIDLSRKRCAVQLPDNLPESGDRFQRIEAEADFSALLLRLPREQQEVVLLRFGHGLKMREIAEAADVPMRTVQSRLNSALKRIKKELSRGGMMDE